jgi:Tol biopolymer transport system component
MHTLISLFGKKAFWTAMVLSLCTLWTSGQEVVQLTFNSYMDTHPMVSGNILVWQGNYRIFAYNFESQETRLVSGESNFSISPFIFGENIAWAEWDGADYEIFIYNLTTEETTRITDNNSHDDYPILSGDHLVWSGGGAYIGSELYYYNLTTGETSQISNTPLHGDGNARISGDYVVWNTLYSQSNAEEVFVYNFKTGITTQITSNNTLDHFPQIKGNIVSWIGRDEDTPEVHTYNLETGEHIQITSDLLWKADVQVTRNYIIWYGGMSGSQNEIFMYDLQTGVTTQITDNAVFDAHPSVFANFIVWVRGDWTSSEVMGYDLNTGITYQITNNSFIDAVPRVDGNIVSWYGYQWPNTEIFYYEVNLPCFPDKTPPAITCPLPLTVGTDPAYFDPCGATVLLPEPEVSDNCAPAGFIEITVETSYGAEGIGPHPNVPVGTHTVTYTATDEWGLASSCVTTLTVVDDDPPIAICDEIAQINFYNTFSLTVPASVFDDGSYDNCGLVSIQGSRNGGLTFSEELTFTCGDAGNIIPIILRAYSALDPASFGECPASVIVEDHLPPSIPCPFNLTPGERIENLIAQITGLYEEGQIGNGPFTSLIHKLEQVLGSLEGEDPCKAIEQLEVFITLVEAFMPNQISNEDGLALIEAAQEVIGLLDCNQAASAGLAVPGFELGQNIPNPFNQETIIPFYLTEETRVTLTVYDMHGARVAALLDEVMGAGNHQVSFQAAEWPQGLYLYSLKTSSGQSATKRMAVVK